MTQAAVSSALESALATWAAGQGLAVAWENVNLTPEPSTTYLRAFVLPGNTLAPDLEARMRSLYGVFQVSIVAPAGEGAGPADDLFTSLEAVFSPSTPLAADGGLSVWFTQPLSRGPAMPEADRYVVPCSLPYQAHYLTT